MKRHIDWFEFSTAAISLFTGVVVVCGLYRCVA
jgi:hypothetical protein